MLALGIALRLVQLAAVYRIGYLYPRLKSGWAVESYTLLRLALQHINDDPNVLPNDTLDYVPFDTTTILASGSPRATSSKALSGAINLLQESRVSNGTNIVGILGTGYSRTIEPSAVYTSLYRKPMVSPGSVSPSTALITKREFPFLLRSVASLKDSIVGLVAALSRFGWSNVAVLNSQGAFGREVFEFFYTMCEQYGIAIAYTGTHPRKATEAQLCALLLYPSLPAPALR